MELPPASACFKQQTVFILEQNNLDYGTAAWRLSLPIHCSAGGAVPFIGVSVNHHYDVWGLDVMPLMDLRGSLLLVGLCRYVSAH